jgi:hypothetical protein
VHGAVIDKTVTNSIVRRYTDQRGIPSHVPATAHIRLRDLLVLVFTRPRRSDQKTRSIAALDLVLAEESY